MPGAEQRMPLHHCLRTYVWGALLGRRDRLDWDDELLYVACLLHDLGLTPAHDGREPGIECFAVEGARAADAFLADAGWDVGRRARVAEAIVLHNNAQVPIAEIDTDVAWRVGILCLSRRTYG